MPYTPHSLSPSLKPYSNGMKSVVFLSRQPGSISTYFMIVAMKLTLAKRCGNTFEPELKNWFTQKIYTSDKMTERRATEENEKKQEVYKPKPHKH